MMLRLCLLLALLAVLAACGADSTPLPADSPPSGAVDVPSEAPGAADASGPLPRVSLQRVFPGLSFDKMTGAYQAADGRWFVTEQAGRVWVFDNSANPRATVPLDLTARVSDTGSEEGLLGFAFAPDFSRSGRFYLYFAAEGGRRRTVVSRFTLSGSTATAASEEAILEVDQPFSNHKGGQLAFGPDGYLYIGLGDGGSGSGRDPFGNGQNPGVLLGKILRIDVSRATGGLNYAIPADNPFVNRSGARGEIWAYGLRNPWRFSFDSATGQLWAGDVGQNAREEIDLVTKGGNYGWAIMEGTRCLPGTTCNPSGLALPVIDYPTAGDNCAVTGGFVYRGAAIPALQGAYVYGDYCSGYIWALRYDGAGVSQQSQIADLGMPLSSFAVDTQGEIYALSYGQNGGIFRLVLQ